MPNDFKPEDIKNYAKAQGYLNDRGEVKDDMAGFQAWADAKKYGVTAEQFDQALGMQAGTTSAWTKKQGLGLLDGVIAPPAPPPSPVNPAVPTPAAGTTTSAMNMGDLGSMIANIVQGVRGATPAAPPAPTQPAAWQPSAAQLAGIDSSQRIAGLLDGPTARQAERQAMERANQRGLLNSSMAVEGAQEAMISNAAEIANADANRFLSLTQAGMQRDTTLDSLFARAGFDERNLQLKAGNDMVADGVNFGLKDAASVRDDNAQYMRDLQTVALDTVRDRQNVAATREYNDRVRQEGYDREDVQTGQALQGAYATQLTGLRDKYNAEVAEIENSDLPPEVKAARVAETKSRYQALVTITNSIFKAMPQWQSQWSQLQLT